jgi:phosphoribosylamine--glycine ligase
MRVLVLGGGGREHALVWRLSRDAGRPAILCAPGNPGIARLARTVPLDPADPDGVLALVAEAGIDLTVVGPELPLTLGIADRFAAAGRPIVGPARAAAEIESSKVFAKAFFARHRVPAARSVAAATAAEARAIVARGAFGFPVVLKADGLAAGKGVIIAPDRETAEQAIRAMMDERRFGEAGARVVIEEYLDGEEVSFFALTDGERVVPFLSAQDHKRIFDGDRGPNTGGMGAFAPCPWFDRRLEARVLDEIVRPVVSGLREEGRPFRGFLYAGLVVTRDGPKVLEFNARLGDPEAQVVLPLLEDDLLPLLAQVAEGRLEREACAFRREAAVGVVLASRGYPESAETGRPIAGVDEAAADPDVVVFHAGTRERDGCLVTGGGRVLTVVGRGADHREAMRRAYAAAAKISFDGLQKRNDIGTKAIGQRP